MPLSPLPAVSSQMRGPGQRRPMGGSRRDDWAAGRSVVPGAGPVPAICWRSGPGPVPQSNAQVGGLCPVGRFLEFVGCGVVS